jgi:hypothetical protein
MLLSRRLFVVPLANNDHGKSNIVRAMVSQGLGRSVQLQRKGVRALTSPWGRPIDAYVFGRSYQEVEKAAHGGVERALDQNDPRWRERELIVMPSHVSRQCHGDIKEMIAAAHSAGFDVVSAAVVLTQENDKSNRDDLRPIWSFAWDIRWTLPNPWAAEPEGQLEALGRDLWTWVCRALAS